MMKTGSNRKGRSVMKKILAMLLVLAVSVCWLFGCGTEPAGQNGGVQKPLQTENETTVPTVTGDTASGTETAPEATETAPETTETVPATEPEEAYELVMVTAGELDVKEAPGEAAPVLYVLAEGAVERIYECRDAEGLSWGRTEDGWICLDYVRWYDTGVKEEDALTETHLIGSWHTLQPDSKADIWTFSSDGSFTYGPVLFLPPDELMESNDEWDGGTFRVEDGQLLLTVGFGIEPGMNICGKNYDTGETARLRLTVSDTRLTFGDAITVELQPGDHTSVLQLCRAGDQPDKELKKKVEGSWFVCEGDDRYGIWEFREDHTYTYSCYIPEPVNETQGTVAEESLLTGSYCVLDDVLYISLTRGDENARVQLGGKECWMYGTQEIPVTVTEDTMIPNGSTDVLIKGGPEEALQHYRDARIRQEGPIN